MFGFGKTDVGMKRENNEDSIFVSNEKIGFLPNLFIIADGMGGHNAGEIASSKAVEYFCESVRKSEDEKGEEILDCIFGSIKFANEMVLQLATSTSEYDGMGTTFTVCVCDGNKLYSGHIGDSRAYVINKSGIEQLTTDHTYVHELKTAGKITEEEAKAHPSRNVITRALGMSADTLADSKIRTLKADDYVLLCSDGLSNMLSDCAISEIVLGKGSSVEKVDALINLANENGGIDNISVIIISMKEVSEQ
ncbi:MAG: Stp1/IreP family PP2C-type Ser/Thr phosphatase [Defluviitaleaceae bacterium]|nr:Stp1/IreP family PP2C-type Ser/Thr phosphatase [Defluviitaleaceae bacterium]